MHVLQPRNSLLQFRFSVHPRNICRDASSPSTSTSVGFSIYASDADVPWHAEFLTQSASVMHVSCICLEVEIVESFKNTSNGMGLGFSFQGVHYWYCFCLAAKVKCSEG